MNTYWRLASVVLSLHWVWTAVLFLGTIAQFPFPAYGPWNILALAATLALQEIWKGICPFTVLENALRARANSGELPKRSIIGHFMKERFGIRLPPGAVRATLAAMLLISLSAWVYRT